MTIAHNAAVRWPTAEPVFALPEFHMGPMSLRTVDAAIGLSKKTRQSLCFIASRRQVDCMALGGGYVNNWTTETLAAYVRDCDPDGRIMLARDHGGPYQREDEKSLSLADAMDRVKTCFRADINSGFRILHLDPEKAVVRNQPDTLTNFTNLTIEMMVYAGTFAAAQGRDVRFEIGTEEGAGADFSAEEWEVFLTRVFSACDKSNIPYPVTFAAPMGTKVRELRNVGALATDANMHSDFWQSRIAALQKLSAQFGLELKLHNSDYLSAEAIKKFRAIGIKYTNVAPELGVVESRTFMQLMRQNGYETLAEEFMNLAVESNKWQRWLLSNAAPSHEEKAMIAGHYIFSTPRFKALESEASAALLSHGIDLGQCLRAAIEKTIQRYLA